MSVSKRTPSSSVKKPTSMSRSVSMPASLSVRMTLDAAEHAEGAVERSAGRDGVDVGAHEHARQGAVAPEPVA